MRLFVAAVMAVFTCNLYAAPSLSDSSLVVSNYLSARDPTAIRFTGPNEGFFIEKGGAVQRFSGGSVSNALSLTVATNSERGLLGLAIDPNFRANSFVYLYYSAASSTGTWTENRLDRYVWNGSSLVNGVKLGTFGAFDPALSNGPNHNGGPLAFGPDGKLYGVTGDLNRSGIEQNLSATQSSRTGGIYRLNPDGTVPGDNPFIQNSNPDVHRWYAYGVRNSFGLAFDPVTGALWDTENGPNVYDEINRVPKGMNSGWAPIMGPDERNAQNAPGDLVMLQNAVYQDPQFSFRDPIGIAALGFLYGSSLGAGYDDAVIFGEANSPNLWLLRLNGARDGFLLTGDLTDRVLDPAQGDIFTPFGTGFSVATDVQLGPDGAVYLAALGADTIYRIAPIPESHTWLLTLAGLAFVGASLRLRSRARP